MAYQSSACAPSYPDKAAHPNPQPAADQPLQLSAGPLALEPVELLAENVTTAASATPPLSHHDPEPEHHPHPEQHPLPNQHSHPHWPHSPRILGHRRSPHTRRCTLSQICRKSTSTTLVCSASSSTTSSAATTSSTAPSRATTSRTPFHLTAWNRNEHTRPHNKTQTQHKNHRGISYS
ncbi:unnamed protein product [Microthlaspi erraticum]|uniref:Uncharacterized protein n=1 Tax=Microthlaspi erraticum TaxID=1685480 RepID=A0A6D2KSJ2_9BRAS|nr:unnamed protein product [Microthlaspi erraticum]